MIWELNKTGQSRKSGIATEKPACSIVTTPNALWTAVWYKSLGLKTTELKNQSGVFPPKKSWNEPPAAYNTAIITVP